MELYYSTYGGLIVIAEVLFFSVIHMQHMIKIASVLTICGGILANINKSITRDDGRIGLPFS